MSLIIADIDLSTAVVGTTGTVDFSSRVAPQSGLTDYAPGQTAHLKLYNESGCGLGVLFNGGAGAKRVPAGGWPTLELTPGDTSFTWTVIYLMPSALVHTLSVVYFAPGETVDETGPLGNSPIGGTVSTPTSTPANNWEQDAFDIPFRYTGLLVTGILSPHNQVRVSGGVAFLRGSDNSWMRVIGGSPILVTAIPNTTYALSLNTDGTYNWKSDGSVPSGAFLLATVTTDGSANWVTVTDTPSAPVNFLPSTETPVILPNINDIVFGQALSANTQLMDFEQGYHLNSDNVGSTTVFPNALTRLWFDAPDLSELEFGPRAGGPTLTGVRFRTLQMILDGTNANGETPVGLQVQGGLTTSLDAGKLTTDGNGNLSRLGNVPTVGFGVPVQVAQALAVAVTVTTLQTILTYAVATTGLYRVSVHVSMNQAGPESLTAKLTWKDPNIVASSTAFFSGQTSSAGTGLALLTGASAITGPLSMALPPLVIYAAAASNIVMQYQDPGGAPAGHVTVLVERLA